MSLSHLLSAVRQLILDDSSPHAALADRKALLSKRFVELSESEVADLAAIPPERLRVYTDLVFAGERGMLESVFPITLAVIHRLLVAAGDERPAGEAQFELVRELHRWRPWQRPSTRELAANFQAFMLDTRRDLVAAWPGLADVIDYERIELEVDYALDAPHQRLTTDDLPRLAQGSVGDLMAMQAFRPPYAVIRHFNHDVVGLAEHWTTNDKLPDSLPGPHPCAAACGRAIDFLRPHWLALDAPAEAALQLAASGRPVAVNDLALAYLDARHASGPRDEASDFAEFFQCFQHWLWSGVLLLPSSSAA